MDLTLDDLGYFFAFESHPGPWPLDGFVNEFGGLVEEHQAVLEEMSARGLVEQVDDRWQPTAAGRQAFEASQDFLSSKHLYDGAKTLSEAAAKLRREAERLEALESDGWQLSDVVEDGQGYLFRLGPGQVEAVSPGGPRSRLSALARTG